MHINKGSKILILRFSSIGDIVLTTPVIRCLKQQTGAEIHYLTKSKFSELLVDDPHIDQLWTFENNWKEIKPALQNEQYDLIVDLHKNMRSYGLSWALGCKTIRFDKLNFRKWLTVFSKRIVLPQKHLVDRYFDALKPYGIYNDGKGLDLHFKKQDLTVFKLPATYAVGVLGATYYTKQIPRVKWEEIIGTSKFPVVLLGGTNERSLGDDLTAVYPGKLINLCGQTTLQQSAAVIQSCEYLITPDTGMMHIGAAFKKSMHVFWGNTIPEFGMYPYYGDEKVNWVSHEVKDLSCRPCSKLGYQQCPKGHFKCMMEQTV
ncbi:MAG: glycosyltransferase family 9 protein [Saprospiraceae bacterium]|nr:glycosyltransferase family 9 protein [Saprospiraceae bacterium]